MAKTPAFGLLRQALRRAHFLRLHPHFARAVEDLELSRGGASLEERRAFLRASAALGMAAFPLSSLVSGCATLSSTASRSRDTPPPSAINADNPVVILGAGLAGLTAAYRFSRAGVACEVFEAQNRLGGRVFTMDRFNVDGMFCELGAEFVDSEHRELIDLGQELGLAFDDLHAGDAGLQGHQYFIRGKRYFDADLARAIAPLARRMSLDLASAFADPSDAACSYDSHSPAAAKLDRTSLEQYLGEVKELEPWARSAIGMAYLTEYGLDLGEQSALNLLLLMGPSVYRGGFGIFGASNEAMRVRGGNGRLVDALGRALDGPVSNARVNLGHRLVAMREAGDQIELSFDAGGGGTRSFRASRVICTLPFSLLREIDGVKSLPLSPVKRRCLAELGFGQNIKHMLGFRSRAWRKPPAGVPPSIGYSFTDLSSQTQWDSSRGQPGQSGILVTFLGGRAARDPSSAPVDAILKDVDEICPGARAQHDGKRAIFRWPQHPFARGSYACPRPGQYTTIIGSAKEPELGGKLLFAGEHVSELYQGYMNGAIETGNLAARRVIGEVGGA